MTNTRSNRRRIGVLASASVIAITALIAQTPNVALAQGAGALDNIVVTARRKEERLQQTPVSVTALTREDLNARSATDLDSIDNFAPNISVSGAPLSSGVSFSASAFIRGIGQGDFLATTDPGVGIYVDDVYLARAQGALLDLSDIERVEVLRGPQGTLFGKNAIGGVIHAVSAEPDEEFSGYGEVSFGRFNRLRVRGDVNVPLTDELFLRVAASVRNSDGYGERRDLFTNEKVDEQGTEDRVGGRARLKWEPTDTFDATLSFDYARVREEAAMNVITSADPTNGFLAFFNGFVADPAPYDFDQIISDDPFVNFNGAPDRDDNRADMDNWGLGLVMNWDLGPVSLKSITSYRDLEVIFGRDGDGGPQKILDNLGELDQIQFSQELQLAGSLFDDRVDWLTGAYFLHEDADDLTDVRVGSGIFAALEALPGAVVPLAPGAICPGDPACAGGAGNPVNVGFDNDFLGLNELETTSYALFATATTRLTDMFAVTTGIRWTHEDKEQVIPFYIRSASGVDAIPPGTSFDESYDAITPKFSLEFTPTDDLLLYASAARGFRSGGFNGRPTLTLSLGPFGQEFLWSYEAGVKAEWFENRLRTNAAFFFSDYSDIQTTVIVNEGATVAPRTDNAGDAEIKGVEVELLAAPTDGLLFEASAGYIDAEYTSLGDAVEISIDNEFPQTPKWTFHLAGQYTLPLSGLGELTTRVDYSYKGDHFIDPQNLDGLFQESYGLLGARMAFTPDSGAYTVAVYGTNLTDEVFITSGTGVFLSVGFDEAIRGRPREFGGSVSINF
ncbi:MAG: TonB-dependent receptor [Pseudomonadota bacterium]